ncbi:MAG: DMT family transporter [Acidobacteriota bacterium]
MEANARGSRVPRLLGLVIGIAAVSSGSVLVRFAQAEAPSLIIAAARLALASAVVVPLAWVAHRREYRALARSEWALGALSGLFLALHFATWITSLELTTVASSVVLVSSSPLFVAIAARLFLKERIRPAVGVGLAVAIAGGVVVGASDSGGVARDALLGDGLALLGSVAVAGYWLIGRRLRTKLSVVPYVAVAYGTAAAVLLAMAMSAGQRFGGYSPRIYLWFVLLALLPQLLGHSSFNWALAHLPATLVAIATLGEPIGASILAYAVLNEVPSALKIAGASLILAGIVVASWPGRPGSEWRAESGE